MTSSIEFTPLATSDPLDIEPNLEPITTRRRTRLDLLAAQIDKIADATINGLGPVLLTVASLLLSTTIFCYFNVFLPFHFSWKEGEGVYGNLGYILNFVWACYLVWGIIANYYFAVRTRPGGVLDGVSSSVRQTLYFQTCARV